jgi:hypothetical protein
MRGPTAAAVDWFIIPATMSVPFVGVGVAVALKTPLEVSEAEGIADEVIDEVPVEVLLGEGLPLDVLEADIDAAREALVLASALGEDDADTLGSEVADEEPDALADGEAAREALVVTSALGEADTDALGSEVADEEPDALADVVAEMDALAELDIELSILAEVEALNELDIEPDDEADREEVGELSILLEGDPDELGEAVSLPVAVHVGVPEREPLVEVEGDGRSDVVTVEEAERVTVRVSDAEPETLGVKLILSL